MKRFKIDFPLNDVMTSLYIEAMDETHRRYSVERTENDPHPMLIEYHSQNDKWEATPGDTWALSEKQINDLGCKIDNDSEKSEPIFSGIHAK